MILRRALGREDARIAVIAAADVPGSAMTKGSELPPRELAPDKELLFDKSPSYDL